MKPDFIEIEIEEQGGVIADCAYWRKKSDEIVLGHLVLKTKHAELVNAEVNEERFPVLYFSVSSHTKYFNEENKNSFTVISFPEYKGWEFFILDGPYKYYFSFALVKSDEPHS
jgi:hypothetical protein